MLATRVRPVVLIIAIVIGVTSWPGTALLIRAQTLSIKARPYMERARALGAGHWHQMTPARAAQRDADGVRQHHADRGGGDPHRDHAAFLGLGDPTRVSWGAMLDEAYQRRAPSDRVLVVLVPPGVCVVLVVLASPWSGRRWKRCSTRR